MKRTRGPNKNPTLVHTNIRYPKEIIEYFAYLVAAAEREKLAAWMMRQGYATGHGDSTEDLLKELEWQIEERIGNEREGGKR